MMVLVRSILRAFWVALSWLLLFLSAAWAFGALWFDFPVVGFRHALALVFLCGTLAAMLFVRPTWRAKLGVLVVIALIAAWWLTLQPRNDRNWQPDVAQTAYAEIDGDLVTIHNVRNCDYRTGTDFTPHWETRTVRLSQITGIDLAINYWGSPWMAHPIVSFQFADAPPLCFSIETRREMGKGYSAIGGLYRQYELIYTVADERDLLRARTNYRRGEEVYLYHTLVPPAQARERFLEYVHSINALHDQARWYNAITANCTTSIRTQRPAGGRMPWDWRILVNGKGDEMMYERHLIATAGLSFTELKRRSLINERARAADRDPLFSTRVREGLPGHPVQQPPRE
jgi:uncharacterized protein DUF4105